MVAAVGRTQHIIRFLGAGDAGSFVVYVRYQGEVVLLRVVLAKDYVYVFVDLVKFVVVLALEVLVFVLGN